MKRIVVLLFVTLLAVSIGLAQTSGGHAGWYKNTSNWDSTYTGIGYKQIYLYVYSDSGNSVLWIANKDDTVSTKYTRLNPGESQIYLKSGPYFRMKAGKTSDSCYVRWNWDR